MQREQIFKWYCVVLHSIYKQRLTPEGQPINEKPEEIKLGAEHEGEYGEQDGAAGATGEGSKQGWGSRKQVGKPSGPFCLI